jgi:hypothetical protein
MAKSMLEGVLVESVNPVLCKRGILSSSEPFLVTEKQQNNRWYCIETLS